VKAANARLKEIDDKICKIENPVRPQFLIDIENSIKAKESPGYEHWCRIFNIKQMEKTLLYIQNNGYENLQSLQSAHQNSANDVTNLKNQIDEINDELTLLRKQKEATETYRRTVDTWREYDSNKWWRQSSKDKFYADNKADIEAYKSARNYIYVELKREKFPNLKNLSGKISSLTSEKSELQKSLTAARKKTNALNVVTHNAKMLLGYKELESQDRTIQISSESPCNVPILKKGFDKAKSTGEMGAYFKNHRINNDCANSIDTAIQRCKSGENEYALEDAAKEILAEYGKERTEWVLAAFVKNAPADKYKAHKEWASRTNKSTEPQNIPIQSHPIIMDKFVERFIEVSNRKRSFAESIEYAKQKMREQEKSRITAPLQRLNRNIEPELD